MRHLSESGAETSSVLYVSPVVVGETPAQEAAVSCLATAACDSAREVLTGVAAGADGAPRGSGRVGDCCGGHAGVPHPHGGHTHSSHGGLHGAGVHALNTGAGAQHFSSMGASLDSPDAAVGGSGGFSPRSAAGSGGHEAFKHGYAKASQIVPYVPLRRTGDEASAGDQLPEVHFCNSISRTCCCSCTAGKPADLHCAVDQRLLNPW